MLTPARSWILSLSALATVGSAQATWIVDASGGFGTHFTEIQPAVAAASAGDLVLVLPGSYGGFTVTQGISVRGGGGSVVVSSDISVAAPAGQAITLSDLSAAGLRVVGSAGPTVIARVSGTELTVVDSAAVQVTGCSFEALGLIRGGPSGRIARSTVSLSGCELEGRNTTLPGLVCEQGARVFMGQSHLRGGFGLAPGVEVKAGATCTVAHVGSVLEGGQFYGGGVFGYAAAVEAGGTLTLDPSVTLLSGQTPNKIAGPGQVITRRVPGLGGGRLLPDTIVTDLHAEQGASVALLAGLPAVPVPLFAGSPWWLLPQATVTVYAVVMGPSEQVKFRIVLPPAPAPVPVLSFQGVALGAGGIDLSNALPITL